MSELLCVYGYRCIYDLFFNRAQYGLGIVITDDYRLSDLVLLNYRLVNAYRVDFVKTHDHIGKSRILEHAPY